jgi:subfamily B ATP-binding cassette protein MsbA
MIKNATQSIINNSTTFIITHRIKTILKADTIIVLDKGRIVQLGSHKELISQEGIYTHLFEKNFNTI